MTSFVLRVDGSKTIGWGHLMRCLALAQAFKKSNLKSVLVAKNYGYEVKKIVKGFNFKIETIPEKLSFDQEINLILKLAKKYHSHSILTDLSNIETLKNLRAYQRYIRILKQTGNFLISIDSLGKECLAKKLTLPFDVIVIPYFGAEKDIYKIEPETKLLLGPDYFVLKEEFIKARIKKRIIKKQAENILISLGSGDLSALINKITKALRKIRSSRLKVKIVSMFKAWNMAELMLWADIAILGSGLIKYEAATLGLPSIIISYDPYQAKINKEFAKSGAALYLGQRNKVKTSDILNLVRKLIFDYNLRQRMSLNGKMLVDGRGGERIINQIKK